MEITAPTLAIAQTIKVTLTGQLSVHNNQNVTTSASFDLTYVMPEIDVVQSIVNQKPAFETVPEALYKFDLADETIEMSVDLG